ncbi:hypothetical protein B0H19DRAFT_1257065 [Mycena capillaripes]|nr:hypothetical protein B0H19DRAFT_1257065 [Mycena capillaripes]
MDVSNYSVWGASAALVFLTSGVIWQMICKSPPPWSKELGVLGQPRDKKLQGTAVVCGGSIAGTVTARILADHFERVILVDPEILDNEKPKTRIMQYDAIHFFLHLFVAGARRLWPDFDQELLAAGARLAPADPRLCYSGIPLITPYHDYPQGRFPETLMIRRSTAQKVLHTLLMKHATATDITLLAGTVRGLEASGDMSSIHSVLVRKPDGTQMHLNDVALVADCTGSTQAGLKWLKSAGFSLPANLRCSYNGNLRYASLCFTVPPELEATLPIPEPATKTGAIYCYAQHFEYGSSVIGLVKTDNNTMQFMVGDSGVGDGDLPRIASDVVPFISGVRGHAPIPSWFLETVTILCEHGNPSFDNIKIPTQSYIQYHSLPAEVLPSNFVAIGDSNLQLNPIHGQGFSKVILNGLAFDSLLRSVNSGLRSLPREFSARYFKKNATYTQGLWDATKLHDYGTSSCQPMEGETKDTGRFVRWFEMKLVSAATQDDEVGSALWHVRHLLAADKILLAPTVLWKTLWACSRF